MTVCTVIFLPFIDCDYVNISCFSDLSYTSGLTPIVLSQSSKYFKIIIIGFPVVKDGASNG